MNFPIKQICCDYLAMCSMNIATASKISNDGINAETLFNNWLIAVPPQKPRGW